LQQRRSRCRHPLPEGGFDDFDLLPQAKELIGQLLYDEQARPDNPIGVRQIESLAIAHTGPTRQRAAFLRVAGIDLQHLGVQLIDESRALRDEVVAMIAQQA